MKVLAALLVSASTALAAPFPAHASEASPAANWEMKIVPDGKTNTCFVASTTRPIFDGYQQVTVQIIVDAKSVALKSESAIDLGSSDVGLRVDKKDFVAADKALKAKQAVFDSNYDAVVKLFKAGREATVQLRFWPTWPATGTHSTSFSLLGFTRAYEDTIRCQP